MASRHPEGTFSSTDLRHRLGHGGSEARGRGFEHRGRGNEGCSHGVVLVFNQGCVQKLKPVKLGVRQTLPGLLRQIYKYWINLLVMVQLPKLKRFLLSLQSIYQIYPCSLMTFMVKSTLQTIST